MTSKPSRAEAAMPTRDQVLQLIARSSVYGNLGLFVGAGFSKAFVKDVQGNSIPLSWRALLERCSQHFNVPFDAYYAPGRSFPEIASLICEAIADSKNVDYRDACRLLRVHAAQVSNWLPNQEVRTAIGARLLKIEPSWIITTNYDFVIESMLVDRSMQLGPNDTFSAPRGLIPILHLHGHRLDPDSIVITQEDYTGLFRPNQYRQTKLPIHIRESTVVSLGYGLGDPNVLMALDWSRNVLHSQNDQIPSEFIQVARANNPETAPYRDRNGVIVLETAEIELFLTELVLAVEHAQLEQLGANQTRLELTAALMDPNKETIKQFVDDAIFRSAFLDRAGAPDAFVVSATIQFLSKCVEETVERSEPRGAFEGYNEHLSLLLDMFVRIPVQKMHPVLFDYLANSLDSVAYYVGMGHGQSWSAGRTWNRRKDEIPRETATELKAYAAQNQKSWLAVLTDSLPE